jgi:hypothetical protein
MQDDELHQGVATAKKRDSEVPRVRSRLDDHERAYSGGEARKVRAVRLQIVQMQQGNPLPSVSFYDKKDAGDVDA